MALYAQVLFPEIEVVYIFKSLFMAEEEMSIGDISVIKSWLLEITCVFLKYLL
jgi:hypothetical protein